MSNSPDERAQDGMEEAAALAGLGLLSPWEASNVPPQEAQRMAAAAAMLAETVTPAPPRPSLKSRLMDRVADFETLKPIADVRPYDGRWVSFGSPGVDYRTLFEDKRASRYTFLVRMAPGSRLAAHHHGDDEQCYVVEGDIRWGNVVYEQGDFIAMGKDTTHPEIFSEKGNLLLIVAGRNEFVHA